MYKIKNLPTKSANFFLALLLLSLLVKETSAAGCNPSQFSSTTIYSAISLASIGIMVSMAIVGLSYMIGNVLNLEGFKDWYKGELYEVTKTLIILGAIVGIMIILSDIALALSGVNTPAAIHGQDNLAANLGALYSSSCGYLAGLENTEYINLMGIYGLSAGIATLQSTLVSLWSPLPIPPFITLIFGVKGTLYYTDAIEPSRLVETTVLSDFISVVMFPVYIITTAQVDLFYIIVGLGFSTLIPFGIILRAIPFLRSIGGTLLAIGIGIVLVYPTLLLALDQPITNYIPSATVPPSVACSGFICTILAAGRTIWAYTSSPLSSLAFFVFGKGIGVNAQTAFSNGLDTGINIMNINSIYPYINTINSYGSIFVLLFLLYILDLLIGIIIVRNIANLLGGNLRLGVGKMSLI
ncbi:MAG: hypothetical protein ACP5RP_01420 [Candidatus Micrarchaeia archaeon]